MRISLLGYKSLLVSVIFFIVSFEQVIVSELKNKISLFDDYVNGIDHELEKGINQHPGNKEIENLRLLWKEKFVKKASKEIEGGKETEPERVCERVGSGMELDREREGEKEMEVDRACEGGKEMEAVFQKSDAQKNVDDQHGSSVLKDKDLQKNSESKDWEKHSKISALTPITLSSFDDQLDPVKGASTGKEPSSEIVAYDGPSFDMALTPAPHGMSTIFK